MSGTWVLHDSNGPAATMATGDQALDAMVGNKLEGTDTWLIGSVPMLGEGTFKISIEPVE